MNGYVKCFDENKYTSFLIKDGDLLKKYDKIWDKATIVGNRFHSEPVYNKKM